MILHSQESLWKFSENFQIEDFVVINLQREKSASPVRWGAFLVRWGTFLVRWGTFLVRWGTFQFSKLCSEGYL
jgi:hypothetical protein